MKKTLLCSIATIAALAGGCAHNDAQMQPNVPSTDAPGASTYDSSANTMPETRTAPPVTTPAPKAPANAAGTGDASGSPPAPTTAKRDAHAGATDAERAASAPSAPPPATGSTDANAPARADADNTRVNKRDQGGANPTPIDQGNNKTDIRITADIRRSVVGDSSLSFTAKNVKIITNGGKVVLRGPVKSAQERATIEAKARATGGVTDVDNQLEVKQ